MENAIKSWTTSILEQQANQLANEIMKLHLSNDDGSELNPKLALQDIVMKELSSRVKPGAVSVKTEPTSDTRGTDMRTLETTFKESISTFKTGQSVNTFVNQLDNCYLNNQVDATGLEVNFCRMLGSKLSDEYKTNLLHLPSAERDSWAKIKAYLLKTYETQETIYQTMAHMWNIKQAPGEDIHSLGIRMEEKVTEVHRQIEAKMKKQSSNKTFDSKDAFMLMGSMLMVQHIQNKESDTYKHMVNEIDNVVKPAQIALKAKSYIDKIGETEPAAINHGTNQADQRKSNPNSAKKEKDCFHWKKHGKCKNGNKCKYRHSDEFKKDKAASKPKKALTARGENKDGQPNPPTQQPVHNQPMAPPGGHFQHPHPGYYGAPPFAQFNYPPMQQAPPQAGNTYTVGNGRQMFDDPNYETCGQEVFQRD